MTIYLILAAICGIGCVLCWIGKSIIEMHRQLRDMEIRISHQIQRIEESYYKLQQKNKALFELCCDIHNIVTQIDTQFDTTISSKVWGYWIEKAISERRKSEAEECH